MILNPAVEVLFAKTSTRDLIFTWSLLSLCQRRRLVDLGTRILGQSWICQKPGNPLSKVLLSSVKATAFAHFCGGETLEDCVATGKQLEAHAGVKCIVDWGVEESSDAKFWDSNTERKVKTLHRAKEVLGSHAAFMPIKLTSLLSPALLERITMQVNHDPAADRGMGWQEAKTAGPMPTKITSIYLNQNPELRLISQEPGTLQCSG
eukprot:s91_g1.t3